MTIPWPMIYAADIQPGMVISFGDHTPASHIRKVMLITSYVQVTYGGRWFHRKTRMVNARQQCWVMNAGQR